jgi:AbrB family looped-hinge helix DNA binding protein
VDVNKHINRFLPHKKAKKTVISTMQSGTRMTRVVSRKGQVTIPIKLRKKFKTEEGSKVQIFEENGKIVIKNSQASSTWREAARGSNRCRSKENARRNESRLR